MCVDPRALDASLGPDDPETGGRVFGLVGGSFGDGAASVLTSGGVGVRVTRHLGLDFEVFHVTGLDLTDHGQPGLVFTDLFEIARDGGLTAFVSRVTADFPVGDRVIPYPLRRWRRRPVV